SPLYKDYPPCGTYPNFDCKDYGDALAEYIRRKMLEKFPGLQIKQLPVWWKSATGELTGHIITVFYWNGYYWIVDAQTGENLGPYPVGTPIDVAPILVPFYGCPPENPIRIDPAVNPGERP